MNFCGRESNAPPHVSSREACSLDVNKTDVGQQVAAVMLCSVKKLKQEAGWQKTGFLFSRKTGSAPPDQISPPIVGRGKSGINLPKTYALTCKRGPQMLSPLIHVPSFFHSQTQKCDVSSVTFLLAYLSCQSGNTDTFEYTVKITNDNIHVSCLTSFSTSPNVSCTNKIDVGQSHNPVKYYCLQIHLYIL